MYVLTVYILKMNCRFCCYFLFYQSLGYPRVSLTLVDTDHGHRPQLKYFDGSFCPQDRATKMSSQIEFYCDPAAGKGSPILQEISNDCHYEFEWPTNVMCPMHVAEFRKNTCEIHNNQTNQAIDLKSIFQNGLVKVSDIDIFKMTYHSTSHLTLCFLFCFFSLNATAKLQQPTHSSGFMQKREENRNRLQSKHH